MLSAAGRGSSRKIEIPKLLIASHNEGKVREIRDLIAPLGIEVVSAAQMRLDEPEETGSTFIENAMIKSLAAAQGSGLPSLSDDSGLAVETLGGAPGIYSARWAGPDKDMPMAIARIERELREKGAEPTGAAAHFVCALSLCFPDGRVENFEGRVDGTLTFPPRGAHGFGYDPIFIPQGERRTFGEMLPAEKHAISHRARAFAKFLEYLS